jgi:hypothetical protein
MHVSRESKKRFLDAAFKLVQHVSDYSGVQQEFKKVNIDRRLGSEPQVLFRSRDEYEDFALDNSDHFELLQDLSLWERKASSSYLHEQDSRKKVAYLIKLIVSHDDEFERVETEDPDNPETYHFRRIFELLGTSLDRPSILWKTTRNIIRRRREVIPHLLADKKYTSIAFQLIEQFEFPSAENGESSISLWKKCIEFALLTIRSDVMDKASASLLVFQIFRTLNDTKYRISRGGMLAKHEKENRRMRVAKEEVVLFAIEDSPFNNHKVHGVQGEYLLPNIAEQLADRFIKFKERDLYNNGTIQFPMMQWDGLTWLMKCSTLWKYQNQLTNSNLLVHRLAKSFFNLYTAIIELKEVSKYNHFDKIQEKGLPLWSEKIERLDLIDWVFPIYFIHEHQLLNSFLAPRFEFDPTTEHNHKANDFTANKLRTHLGVLILVLRKLVLPSVPYGLEKLTLLKIKSRIESQIVEYLTRHVSDVPQEGRIDLFDFYKEWGFDGSDREALLPQIARAINWFENKKEIIEALVRSQDIIKLLTIAEWVTSEGVRLELLGKVRQANFPEFLRSLRGIPTEQVLVHIRRYPELIGQINQVVEIWKQNAPKKDKEEYAVKLFTTELLLAYFQGNETAIKELKEPKVHSALRDRDLSSADLKSFYIGLLRIKSNPREAYDIFERLTSRYHRFYTLALNRMAAKINMADKNGNDENLYREALEEWKDYSIKHDLHNDSLDRTVYANKIYALHKLQEHVQLDDVFNGLDLPFQMLPDILSIKVESLIDRKKVEDALSLLEEADNYHQFSGLEEVQFIKDLKSKVNGIDNVTELRMHYSRIFDSAPSKLIRILPDRINGRIDLLEFMVKEVGIAASRMLDKINALPQILKLKNTSKENRFNDILELALEARISSWGWSVKAQNRKAFSPTKKDLGEIDLDIRDFNVDSLLTCEAFILREKSKVKGHLKKLISSYTHQRKLFLVITYYEGLQKGFEAEWSNYWQKTLISIQYPSGYELDSNGIVDVTREFGYENTAIRICKGTLKSGSLLFNIFINIKYSVK